MVVPDRGALIGVERALVVLVLAHQVADGVVEPFQPGVFVLRFGQLAVGVVGEGLDLLWLAGALPRGVARAGPWGRSRAVWSRRLRLVSASTPLASS